MEPNNSNKIDILQSFPLFEGIDAEQLEQIASRAELERIGKHRPIYELGDRSDKVFFLIKGTIKIGIHSEDGREVIKYVLHPMAMFGELCLAGEQNRKEFAIAMSKGVELISVRSAYLQAILRSNFTLASRTLNFIGQRLQRVESRLESLIFKDARQRIIDFLKDSANRQGKRIGYEMLIRHCLTQQDIANITGTSRQTVTSVLNDLKKSNLIHFNRRSILIRDLAKLA